MIFSKLEDDRLRISLTRTETVALFGSANITDRNVPHIKTALKLLLKKAMYDRLLRPDILSVGVEIMRNLSGGYDIYLHSGKYASAKQVTTRWVLEFLRAQDAIYASRALQNSGTAKDSSLYKVGGRYRLVVSCSKAGLPLAEFADRISDSPLFVALTEEHGKKLIESGAVEILADL